MDAVDAGAEPEDLEPHAAFRAALRQYRMSAGLTQEALAERAGLGVRTVQGLEGGESRPRRGTLRRLAEGLELRPDEAARLAVLLTNTPALRKRSHNSWYRG